MYFAFTNTQQRAHVRFIFFLNIKAKGLAPCALSSLSTLCCHQLTPLPPSPDLQSYLAAWEGRRAKFWLGMSRSCVHKPSSCGKAGAPGSPTGTGVGSCPIARHGRAERSDGTCLGLNSQCFPPMFGTNTLLRSHNLSLYRSLLCLHSN